MEKPKLFLDMDNVLVDTLKILNDINMNQELVDKPDQIPGIFRHLPPMPGAVRSVSELSEHYDLYILSTAPWENATAWQDKLVWLQNYFGDSKDSPFYKRVFLAHDKSFLRTENGILIDDRPYHGASGWDDANANSQWIQYAYRDEFTWETKLVPLLIEISDTFKENQNIREAIESVFSPYNMQAHGDTAKFLKAPWE